MKTRSSRPLGAQQAAVSRHAEAIACAVTAFTPSSPGRVRWCWSRETTRAPVTAAKACARVDFPDPLAH
ncbi:hypothetical protein AB0K48_23495 [Nonomuraea sp. NPDC055795]